MLFPDSRRRRRGKTSHWSICFARLQRGSMRPRPRSRSPGCLFRNHRSCRSPGPQASTARGEYRRCRDRAQRRRSCRHRGGRLKNTHEGRSVARKRPGHDRSMSIRCSAQSLDQLPTLRSGSVAACRTTANASEYQPMTLT
jgi:hypothetical protein